MFPSPTQDAATVGVLLYANVWVAPDATPIIHNGFPEQSVPYLIIFPAVVIPVIDNPTQEDETEGL